MKILVIDDQKLFVDGIKVLLANYDSTISTQHANSVFEAQNHINSILPPDLILLNVNNTTSSYSYDLMARLKKLNLDIPVIVISATASAAEAGLAIENNASGFITKNCSRATTLEAILSVLNGKIYVSKPTQSNSDENNTMGINVDKVTTRQKEVLYLLSQGLLNKQIATELDISANTVKAHLHDLFRSLNVSNRTAAVKYGQRCGLI